MIILTREDEVMCPCPWAIPNLHWAREAHKDVIPIATNYAKRHQLCWANQLHQRLLYKILRFLRLISLSILPVRVSQTH